MKLAHYQKGNDLRVGIVTEKFLYDISDSAWRAGMTNYPTTASIDSLLASGTLERLTHDGEKLVKSGVGIPLDSLKLRSPILAPQKILLVAVNYKAHGKESNVAPPSSPYLFAKFSNALIGPEDPILKPKVSQKVDWEVELAVIIGKRGKYISKDKALDHVAGYAVSNDISFRDFQLPPGFPEKLNPFGMNWIKGKSLDASFPLGPWLVTRDEIPDPQVLDISLAVNGQTKQSSNTSEMIFKVDDLIEYISSGITVMPGDIISTGTPHGVASGTGQPYLKDGDLIEATIQNIGTLRNPVKAE